MVGSGKHGRRGAPAGDHPALPGAFAFHGFGAFEQDELRKIERLRLRTDPPRVAVVDDAVFVPDSATAGGTDARFAGGVFDAGGAPVDLAETRRKGGRRVGGPAMGPLASVDRELDTETVYLGRLFNHYGRVLLESLARVWVLDRVEPSVKVFFNDANGAQFASAPWVRRLLALFGISPERILSLDSPTRLPRVIVPEALFEQFHAAHVAMLPPFRAVAERVAGDLAPSSQPLYLSRRRLSSRQRPIVGEAELEETLRENGLRIAYPETMPIEEQIRLVNSHADIVSAVGSAAHSVLFALGAPRLHLLVNQEHLPTNYYLCSALAGVPTAFVNCLTAGCGREFDPDGAAGRNRAGPRGRRGEHDPDPIRQSTPQMLDLPRALDYLDRQGFLGRRPPAPDPAQRAIFCARFDEAAVYSRLRRLAERSHTLPGELEPDALRLAATSWPVNLMLARFYAAAGESARVETHAKQFAMLAAAEPDHERLAHYAADVAGIVARIVRLCTTETAACLGRLLAGSFGATPPVDDAEPRA